MSDNPWSAISFSVILPPRGQARARHRSITTNDGRSFHQAYKTKDQQQDEEKLTALLLRHAPGRPLAGPLKMTVTAYFPIPRSKPKKWIEGAVSGEIRPEVKPDASNCLKHLEDVMNGVFFGDDKQLVGVSLEKMYGDVPRYEITILYRRDRQEGLCVAAKS